MANIDSGKYCHKCVWFYIHKKEVERSKFFVTFTTTEEEPWCSLRNAAVSHYGTCSHFKPAPIDDYRE